MNDALTGTQLRLPLELYSEILNSWTIDEFYNEFGIFADVSGPGFVYHPSTTVCIRATKEVGGTVHGFFGFGTTIEQAKERLFSN